MDDGASVKTIEARLSDFLTAERRRAEADYPHLHLPASRARSASAPLGLAVLAAVAIAAVALLRPWGGVLPTTPGADPRSVRMGSRFRSLANRSYVAPTSTAALRILPRSMPEATWCSIRRPVAPPRPPPAPSARRTGASRIRQATTPSG
jgi:hypothetical protein